jgi:aquaporin-3
MRIRNEWIRLFLAEAFGTFLLCAFGLASVAQYFFTPPAAQNSLYIVLAFGFAVTIAILVTGKASGAHLNPAVTFAAFLTGRASLARLALYTAAQLVGAFLGSACVYVIYLDSFLHVSGIRKPLEMVTVFITAPNAGMDISSSNLFLDQVISTALLIVVLQAIGDARNERLTHEGASILVGFLVIAIGLFKFIEILFALC